MKTFYSKKILGDFAKIKKSLQDKNSSLLKEVLSINKMYLKQTKRKYCKNCLKPIKKTSFVSFGVSYSLCKVCNHINGLNEDTDKFLNYLYYSDKSKEKINYAKRYLEDFEIKVKNIYLPKARFLKKIIKKKNIKLLDLGCGGGHFLKACESLNIEARGYDSNKKLINLANKKLKKNDASFAKIEDIEDIILNSEGDCISLISVLEHIQNPSDFFKIFKKSNFKYIYISIPLFSLTSLLEHSFKEVFPRNLYGPHTHMYTKESIYYIIKKNNLKIAGEWWFGSDFSDLSRSLLTTSKFKNNSDYKLLFNKFFYKHIDKLQSVLDKEKMSSDLQIIVKK